MKISFIRIPYSGSSFGRRDGHCLLTKCEECVNFNWRISKQRGGPTEISLLTFLLFLILSLFKIMNADPFVGAEWNPTGNAIGGGPGYTEVVTSWDYYVTTKAALLSALGSAGAGDVIYIADDAEIDMGSTKRVVIPGGVTLASGRGKILGDTISWGGLIYTNEHDEAIEYLFRTGGNNVRITGLRLQGPDPEVGDRLNDHSYHRLITSLQLQHNNAEVDNCEIYGWSRSGIQVTSTVSSDYPAYIHHNHIHHNRGAGLGYGIVMSGNSDVIIEANYFNYCRHYIASTGDYTQSYEARWNMCGRHGNFHGLDRHGTAGYGGKLTLLHHNTLKNTAPQHCYGVSIRGVPIDTARINNNWFWQPDSASAIELVSNENVVVYGNQYDTLPSSGVSAKLPVAVINVNTDSGGVPLSVSFDGTNSYDNDGAIAWYQWTDGDGNNVRNAMMNHTYDDVGIYNAELTVLDNAGIEDIERVTIIAAPTSDSQFLSLWVKDSYRDDSTGFFSIQIFVNSTMIWTQDVAGDSNWIHVVENVTNAVGNNDSITITLQVYCEKDMTGEFTELEVYFDDVALFWGDVKNGNFEDAESDYWIYDYNTGFLSTGYYVSEDTRSGNLAYMITQQYQTNCYEGSYGKVMQKVEMGTLGTSLDDDGLDSCSLFRPYPNPGKDRSTISYQLPAKSTVSLKIYDVHGRLIKTLMEEEGEAGYHQVYWDGMDEKNNKVANGVYFCRLSAGDFDATRKLVLLR